MAFTLLGSLNLVFAFISVIILIVGAVYALYNWGKLCRYKPEIIDKWAEGTILRRVDPQGKEHSKIPCVYIYIKLDPKNEIIHNCEIEVKNGWFAYFDSGGYTRYDVQREENLHLGRYEIDVKKKTLQFIRPIWEAQTLRPYGGWNGTPTELKTEELVLVVSGEVKGKRLKSTIPLNIDVRDLLKKRKWQSITEAEKQFRDMADKIIDKYLVAL